MKMRGNKTIIEQAFENIPAKIDSEVIMSACELVSKEALRLLCERIEKINRGSLLHPYLEIKRSDYLELKKQEKIDNDLISHIEYVIDKKLEKEGIE